MQLQKPNILLIFVCQSHQKRVKCAYSKVFIVTNLDFNFKRLDTKFMFQLSKILLS